MKNSNFTILRNTFIIAALLVLAGCDSSSVDSPMFYPIDSLLSAQVKVLTKTRATMTKMASLGKEQSTNTYTPADTIAWQKELEILRQINLINKPVNRGLYKMSDHTDEMSNLSVRTFEATDELPVEYLKVFYGGSLSNVRKIEARVREENSMYVGMRLLRVEFKDYNGLPVIKSYLVEGGQKMFVGDSVHYTITANISLAN